jgi:hypothetical protein
MPPSPSREEAHLGDARSPRSVLKPHLALMLKEAPTWPRQPDRGKGEVVEMTIPSDKKGLYAATKAEVVIVTRRLMTGFRSRLPP